MRKTILIGVAFLVGCSSVKAPAPFETVVRIEETGEVGYLKQAGVECRFDKAIPVKVGEIWKFSSEGCKFEKVGEATPAK